MPRRYSTPVVLIALAVAAGCGPTPDERSTGVPAVAPENSGADRPVAAVVAPDKRTDGPGFPDRLSAGLNRAVRGDVEVRVDSADVGERVVVYVSVRTRGDKPVTFTDWTDAKAATMTNPEGKAFPLLPPTTDEAKTPRAGGPGRPAANLENGAGEVTRAKPRVTVLRFEQKAVTGEHVDLDLDGAAVGFTDPIRFRIPRQMLAPPMGR